MRTACKKQIVPIAKTPSSVDQSASQTLADRGIARYANGDEAAFGTLYDELAPPLY